MKFESKRSLLVGAILLITGLILIASSIPVFTGDGPAWLLVLTAPTLTVIGWIWFDTCYVLDNGQLRYISGPFRGTIAVESITSIRKGVTSWVGFRPAIGTGGLHVTYGKWDEIYISPRDETGFLQCLKEINNTIEIR